MPRLTKYSATERQKGKKELIEQLPTEFLSYRDTWWTREDYGSCYDEDWVSSSRFNEVTIGGKFLMVLTKLNILEQEVQSWGRAYYKHIETYHLFEKLAIAPDGYIYVQSGGDVYYYKLDIPPKSAR